MQDMPVYFRYWGKADSGYEGEPKWHPFAYHSLDVAAVAEALWDCSSAIRRAFHAAFATDDQSALRAWVLFFVALHDVGKLHALFQIKASDALAAAWRQCDPFRIRPRPYDHGCDGFAQADEEIPDWIGSSRPTIVNAFAAWLGAVAGHHGSICLPNPDKLIRGYAAAEIRDQDTAARLAWVQEVAELFLSPACLSLRDTPPSIINAARNLLAGFCSLCDWIGSNAELFPYRSPSLSPADYLGWARGHLATEDALRRFGLTATPLPYRGISALLRSNETPRGVQILVDALPIQGGMTIVEAPTGSGKTEAALAYAWRLLETGTADTVVFALPTQATANAMLTRAQAFAAQAYGLANVVLAHGNRDLHAGFRQLVDAARPGTAQRREEAGVQCSAWLASSRKRVFLGQIGVCTVDQVLLSVLPVRHSFVRAFGLSRAVLIVDEVHAYDAYMNGLLKVVLQRQKAAGGSAVLLSATLPSAVRRELLEAWDCAADEMAPYPTLWTTRDGKATPLALPETACPDERTVAVRLHKVDGAFPDEALLTRIVAAAQAGALVGIVLNTVDDAQRLTRHLRNIAGEVPVDLFHARFRLCDRQAIEHDVLAQYGREAERKSGRILVATQVIEQSLDLDFDWLVTQLCPVDLLFQRLGRLHRHARAQRPPGCETPTCTVLSPPDADYGLHALIYGDPRLLWRTEQLLVSGREIVFPAAYRDWIEQVYGDAAWNEDAWGAEPDQVTAEHYTWIQKRKLAEAEAKRLTSTTMEEFRDEDSRATSLTRDGEMSLSLLPTLGDGCLLDGTRVADLEERHRPEIVLLNSVPAPASWEKWLSDFDRDEEGQIRLVLNYSDLGVWTQSKPPLRYSITFGLEREEGPK
jgi:CRISPR-associated endonuclease/helicase Cas3